MCILNRVLIAATLIMLAITSTLAATLTVTNTNDSGPGSLREAILTANANAGTDLIAFNIPGVGPHSIQPLSDLPTVTDSLTIDGYTQPGAIANTNPPGLGNNALLKIELDGSNTFCCNGLEFVAANSTVRGLVINRFFRGIGTLGLSAAGMKIQGNFIGTDVSGMLALSNANGIRMSDASDITIGGTLPDQGNLISGNGHGIVNLGGGVSGISVQGNLIGTDVSGTTELENGTGILSGTGMIIGGTMPGARNTISGNGTGLKLSSGNTVIGNFIGTDVTGILALPPTDGNSIGIELTSDNLVGGITAESRNVISGNGTGIKIRGSDNVVQGNFIGTDLTGTTEVSNGKGIDLFIGPKRNIVGGVAAGTGNLISGNGVGIRLIGGTTTDNRIEGNLIGTEVTGSANLGNQDDGISIESGARLNIIGGAASGAGNIISWNGGSGVVISSSQNLLQANTIRSNGLGGVLVESGIENADARLEYDLSFEAGLL